MYTYSYCDYWIFKMARHTCCFENSACCSKYKKQYDLYASNKGRMENELDIIRVIETLRSARFM